jgi:hypothetical protein
MAKQPKPAQPRKETPHVEPKKSDPNKEKSAPKAGRASRR